MKISGRVQLKVNKEIPIQAGHPWVFSNAIHKEETRKPGDLVKVISLNKEFIGIGMWNPHSSIRVRMLTLKSEEINDSFFEKRFLKLDRQKKPFRLEHKQYQALCSIVEVA